jgi:hypothetical protein
MKAIFVKSYQMTIAAPPVVPTHVVSHIEAGGDAIAIKRDDPTVKTMVGMDGRGAVLVTSKRSGTITVKLMQTSPSNKVFAAIMGLIEGGTATYAPVYVQFTDTARQDRFVGVFGVLTKWPDFERGDDFAKPEWEIWVERLDILLGDPLFQGLAMANAEAAF